MSDMRRHHHHRHHRHMADIIMALIMVMLSMTLSVASMRQSADHLQCTAATAAAGAGTTDDVNVANNLSQMDANPNDTSASIESYQFQYYDVRITKKGEGWVDIRNIGIRSDVSDVDDGFASSTGKGSYDTVSLGWPFVFYGESTPSVNTPHGMDYQVYINPNGFISFSNHECRMSGESTFCNWPGVGLKPFTRYIGPLLTDLNPSARSYSSVYYYVQQSPRRFVVSWYNMTTWHEAGQDKAGSFTFQIILESDGGIIFNYQSLPWNPAKTPRTSVYPNSFYPLRIGVEDSYTLANGDRQTYGLINLGFDDVYYDGGSTVEFTPRAICSTFTTCDSCTAYHESQMLSRVSSATLNCGWCVNDTRSVNGSGNVCTDGNARDYPLLAIRCQNLANRVSSNNQCAYIGDSTGYNNSEEERDGKLLRSTISIAVTFGLAVSAANRAAFTRDLVDDLYDITGTPATRLAILFNSSSSSSSAAGYSTQKVVTDDNIINIVFVATLAEARSVPNPGQIASQTFYQAYNNFALGSRDGLPRGRATSYILRRSPPRSQGEMWLWPCGALTSTFYSYTVDKESCQALIIANGGSTSSDNNAADAATVNAIGGVMAGLLVSMGIILLVLRHRHQALVQRRQRQAAILEATAASLAAHAHRVANSSRADAIAASPMDIVDDHDGHHTPANDAAHNGADAGSQLRSSVGGITVSLSQLSQPITNRHHDDDTDASTEYKTISTTTPGASDIKTTFEATASTTPPLSSPNNSMIAGSVPLLSIAN